MNKRGPPRRFSDEERAERRRAQLKAAGEKLKSVFRERGVDNIQALLHYGDGWETVLLAELGDDRATYNLGSGCRWRGHNHRIRY
jgi:hypothetical protein